jgi:alpha-L-fucosidase
VNGDAIYGTRSWTTSRQWSAGEVPSVKYNSEFESAYDVTTLVNKPAPGKASIEAFFTMKGNNIYAILPRWPAHSFLLKDVKGVKSATLLGSDAPLKFTASASGTRIELPPLPEDLLHQPAWVLKVNR